MVVGMDLHLGDCLGVMRGLADGSVDSVVTDPPGAIGFMGKAWDSNRGGGPPGHFLRGLVWRPFAA
jgi:DNA modification methylase